MADGKFNKIGFIVVIVLLSILIIGTLIGRAAAVSSLTKQVNELDQYILENHSNIALVKNGINMSAVKNDSAALTNSIFELKNDLWPHVRKLGFPRILYDMASDNVIKNLQKTLLNANTSEDSSSPYTDENGILTVSSMLKGLKAGIIKIINIITIIIVIIFAVILGIHILKTLLKKR